MEYLFAVLLLHSVGEKIDETGISNVLEAAKIKVDNTKVKALVVALEGVDIDKTIAREVHPIASQAVEIIEDMESKEVEEKEKEEEQAMRGLADLFG